MTKMHWITTLLGLSKDKLVECLTGNQGLGQMLN